MQNVIMHSAVILGRRTFGWVTKHLLFKFYQRRKIYGFRTEDLVGHSIGHFLHIFTDQEL